MQPRINIIFLVHFLFIAANVSLSQPIKSLFTQSVDNSVSQITDAVQALNIEDTICYYIDGATESVDIAVWDNGSSKIVSSLNSAYQRGVEVRYITSSNSLNTALGNLNSNIPKLVRQASLSTNVMHNKFVNIDKQIVLTGSMNFGNGSMFLDYNNVVIVTDSLISQNYKTEFDEMWGSSDLQPNSINSKFGPAKTDNTQHLFSINSSNVELYFSPSDATTSHIINAINSADYTLDFAMFTFINNDIGDAVKNASNRGVVVRGIIENVGYIGSEYDGLIDHGIEVLSHENISGDFHHKYCIIDASYPSSDPIVITGSHNWTNSAESDNDENTLIIHDYIIANQYWEEFESRYLDITYPVSEIERQTPFSFIINEAGNLIIQLEENIPAEILIYNPAGLCLMKGSVNKKAEISLSTLPLGFFILEVNSLTETKFFKFFRK